MNRDATMWVLVALIGWAAVALVLWLRPDLVDRAARLIFP